MSHGEFARENEEFADEVESKHSDRKNWVVTIRFYSYVHYVEEVLQSHDYNSKSHRDRKKNIRNCKYVDNQAYRVYRWFEDISQLARYECVRMDSEKVTESEDYLSRGKGILGFGGSGSGGSHKYST